MPTAGSSRIRPDTRIAGDTSLVAWEGHKMSRRWFPVSILSATAACTAHAGEIARFQGLGDLPGGPFARIAWDASADGSVVIGYSVSGQQSPTTNIYQAFRWTQAEGMVPIGWIPGGENEFSEAIGVSSDGS